MSRRHTDLILGVLLALMLLWPSLTAPAPHIPW